MSHLGTKILYSILNQAPDIACERAFAPWGDCEAQLRQRGLPVLTLETASPLARLRRHRDLAAVRADLHQRPQPDRSGGLAAARRRPRRRRAAGDRGGADRNASRAAGAVRRRVLHRRRGGAPAAAGARGGSVAPRRRAAPRAPLPPGRALPYPLYVPELYATEIDAETGFVVVGRAARPACRRGPSAYGSPTSTDSRSPTIRRCRTRRRSSIAWRSRSRAVAPRAAASARPA